MNLEYLVNQVLPQRAREIEEGKNLATRNPIYVVLDLVEKFCTGHTDYELTTNLKGIHMEFGYIDQDLESESQEFLTKPDGMEDPCEVTRFYTDRIVAFFLTSEAAHEYIKKQSHNLGQSYVYVFYAGYGNHQMDMLFETKHPENIKVGVPVIGSSLLLSTSNKKYKMLQEKYGETHTIDPIYGTKIDLTGLSSDECIAAGDGKNYYFKMKMR